MTTNEVQVLEKQEDSNLTSEYALETIITNAIKIPGVKVDREKFLAETLVKETDDIQQIIELGPISAGIDEKRLRKIADRLILDRTTKSSFSSFVMGIPGGFAMAATIPADVLQFYVFTLKLAQELTYLYGAKDLWNDGQVDEDRADVIDKQLDSYGNTYGLSSNQIDAKKLAVASTVTAVLATTYKGDEAIFRWSNKTYTALTPRPNKPTELGVSFLYDCSAFESISSLLVSSEGLVNSTGILKAVNDHGNHVDVRPNGYSIEEWKASRANASTNPHPCTVALYNVCTKVLW